MTIHLISSDAELYKLCSEILAEIPELSHPCILTMLSPDEGWREADLHIWDFHPNVTLPDNLNWRSLRHLFLVDRAHLSSFYNSTGAVEGSVLLKPVSRATLTTFLRPSVTTGAANFLRADRDEFLQCLIQTNLRLQEYDHDRTTFLARAVHDFRAPLTALNGYCGLLLSEALGGLNQSQRDVLERMQHSAKRLSRMANAMFELSVGRQVKRCADLKPGDLRECLEQALYEITPFADEKSISITTSLDNCGEGLYFEAGQLEQVFINVLDNAC